MAGFGQEGLLEVQGLFKLLGLDFQALALALGGVAQALDLFQAGLE
ncbi:hypothetical protein [Deinococcus aquaticus]